MGEISAIEWTDGTFNPWWGCSRVSPACRFCYADRDAKRWGMDLWRRNGTRKSMSEDYWRKPLAWNRKAERAGVPLKVFCASMADVFEDHPQVGPWRTRLFELIEATPWLAWQLLTKRPENVTAMVPWAGDWPRNIWLGVSAESQRFADERIPILSAIDGVRVRFLSCEPLLGSLDLVAHFRTGKIGWCIAGGESGPKARATHPGWFRGLRNQCEAADVPFLFKQFGEYSPYAPEDHDRPPALWVSWETGKAIRDEADVPAFGSWQAMWRPGKKAAGRILDGEDLRGFPDMWTPTAVAAR